jgi:hypothetical protein
VAQKELFCQLLLLLLLLLLLVLMEVLLLLEYFPYFEKNIKGL